MKRAEQAANIKRERSTPAHKYKMSSSGRRLASDKANHPGRQVGRTTQVSGLISQDMLFQEPGTGLTTDSAGNWSTGRAAGPVATGPHAGTARELRAGGGTRLPLPPAKVRRDG